MVAPNERESAISFDANNAEQPGFLTVKETARYLRLCEKQVRRLIWRGELPAYRFGTALRIKKQISTPMSKRSEFIPVK